MRPSEQIIIIETLSVTQTGGGGTPTNAYVAEDGTTFYVAEDGTTFYVQES